MVFLWVADIGVTWWLGLYLLAREPRSPVARRAGVGLLGYALALGTDLVRDVADTPAADAWLGRLLAVLVCVPALAWTGACIQLLPETVAVRDRLDRVWSRVLVPLSVVALGPALWAGALPEPGGPVGPSYVLLAVLVSLPLLGTLVLVVRAAQALRPAPVGALLAVATLMFGLGAALLFVPTGAVPRTLMLLAVDVDLVLLGLAVAWCAAFDAGERLRRDMLRSLLAAGAVALLFGGQVAAAMALGDGVTPALTALLLGVVVAAVGVQVLSGPVHGLIDRVAFARAPALSQARAELRDTADALPRRDDDAFPAALEPEEFARLTRRALGHYGDLARLTSSPLVNLPEVTERLAARHAPDQPLERAAELKALLLESIGRLKPREGEFGTSEEWRYYNALYFPYVVGLRPYRRHLDRSGLDPVARRALDWFATQVPERTLYNWQNAAARLVADDLRSPGDVPGRRLASAESAAD
jgi:hypothetical protein